jgi:hypothetical protein
VTEFKREQMPSRDFVTFAATCNEATSFSAGARTGRYVALWHFFGPCAMSDLSPVCAPRRTSANAPELWFTP